MEQILDTTLEKSRQLEYQFDGRIVTVALNSINRLPSHLNIISQLLLTNIKITSILIKRIPHLNHLQRASTKKNAPYVKYNPATNNATATSQDCHSNNPTPHAAVNTGKTPAEPKPNNISVHLAASLEVASSRSSNTGFSARYRTPTTPETATI